MTDFGGELRRLIAERGLSLNETARRVPCDPGYLSKIARGLQRPSPGLCTRLDEVLDTGGELRGAAPPVAQKVVKVRQVDSSAVEALRVAMAGDPDAPDIGSDGLAELVGYYGQALAVAPSAAMYTELLSARSFAGTLLDRCGPRQRLDLTVTAGWLSSLLAISAADLGDHAAAVVWCADTERRGHGAGYPELLGWAALTRALIAWYQGDPLRSAAAATHGQAEGQPGSVAYAKLAAHEMRCRAMLGDSGGMTNARHRAATAAAQIGPSAPSSGVYSLPRADDPPYTATSLLLAGQHAEAAAVTRRLIESAYRPQAAPWDQPTNYARTLLILALALAGQGDLGEAAAAGTAALECGQIVWPTMVLAGKLDQSLAGQFPGDARAADFHARYLDAGNHFALNAPPSQPGRELGAQ
jgi:transcriptional regulator with XRE-family HTH domain